jgi:hypothetical protein
MVGSLTLWQHGDLSHDPAPTGACGQQLGQHGGEKLESRKITDVYR